MCLHRRAVPGKSIKGFASCVYSPPAFFVTLFRLTVDLLDIIQMLKSPGAHVGQNAVQAFPCCEMEYSTLGGIS